MLYKKICILAMCSARFLTFFLAERFFRKASEEGWQLISHLPQDTDLSLCVLTGKTGNLLSYTSLPTQVILQNAWAVCIVIALWG